MASRRLATHIPKIFNEILLRNLFEIRTLNQYEQTEQQTASNGSAWKKWGKPLLTGAKQYRN